MADNTKLKNAKAVKNDEFYTCYDTISNEIGHYRDQFKGQIVYCNCDDPTWSNFWRYFHSNFASLGLRKLIATHYAKDSQPSYAMIYEGGDDFNMDAGKIVEIVGNDDYSAGDFRSDACITFLNESSIVCTNPPFSLFREYIATLVSSGKKFLVLGNQNAATTKDIFPLFKENKMWYGASIHSGGIDFRMPDDYDEYSKNVFIKEDGHHYINLAGIRWFTNMDVKYRHDGLWHLNGKFDNTQAHKYYEGNETLYPMYDNYDAIEVNKTKNVPIDFDGIMGVPVTFLDKFNPDEFELLGCTQRGCHDLVPDTKKYDDYWEVKQDGTRTKSTGAKTNENGNLAMNDGKHNYFINAEGHIVQSTYSRLFIRNRNPISKSKDLGY